MQAGVQDATPNDTKNLRQVVFLTDGAIGNEEQLFSTLARNRGRSRVFMLSIGSAPNSYLKTRAAELGRGTFMQIGDASDVTAKMQDLHGKIGNPVVTELKVELDVSTARLTPDMLLDLYRGEPVLRMSETQNLDGSLKISGSIGN
jgi:Ca-activated chloride channel family protein